MNVWLLRAVTVVTALGITSAEARAQPPEPAPSPAPPLPPSPASASSIKAGGWAIVIASLAVGAAVTGVSISKVCPPHDDECERWVGLGIWSGVGIVALGTTAGLLIVRAASQSARVQVSLTGISGTF